MGRFKAAGENPKGFVIDPYPKKAYFSAHIFIMYKEGLMAATDIEEGPDDSLTGIFQFYQPATVSAEGIKHFKDLVKRPDELKQLAEKDPARLRQYLQALLNVGEVGLVAKAFATDRVVYEICQTQTGTEFVANTMKKHFSLKQNFETLMARAAWFGFHKAGDGNSDLILDIVGTFHKDRKARFYADKDNSSIYWLSRGLHSLDHPDERKDRILNHLISLTPSQKALVWTAEMSRGEMALRGLPELARHNPEKFEVFATVARIAAAKAGSLAPSSGAGAPEAHA